jgi:hypothetical protein
MAQEGVSATSVAAMSSAEVDATLNRLFIGRALYTPMGDHAKQQKVVAVCNFMLGKHFNSPTPTSWAHLKEEPRMLFNVLVNIAAYCTGNKPWRSFTAGDIKASGNLVFETLVDRTGIAVGVRVYVLSHLPASTALRQRLIERCDPALAKELKKQALEREKRQKAAQKAAARPTKRARKSKSTRPSDTLFDVLAMEADEADEEEEALPTFQEEVERLNNRVPRMGSGEEEEDEEAPRPPRKRKRLETTEEVLSLFSLPPNPAPAPWRHAG